MPQVRITFTKEGGIKSDAVDFKGGNCEKATQFLDELFGEPTKRERKPEYYEEVEETDVLTDGMPSGYCG